MNSKIIDGESISVSIGENLKRYIDDKNISPSLGILFLGNDEASKSFVLSKKKFAEKYGFKINILNIKNQEDLNIENIKEKIKSLEKENDGVIVQLPLPESLKENTESILDLVSKEKDVDSLSKDNHIFFSPIVLSFLKIISNFDDLNNKKIKITIFGNGRLIGQSLINYFNKNKEKYGFNLITEKDDEDDILSKIKDIDVIILGVGKDNLLKKEYLNNKVLVIDYGTSQNISGNIVGDFNPNLSEYVKAYTPTPKGTGRVVVASLFENILKSYKIKNNINL